MVEVSVAKRAYCKLFLHLAKYPHSSCNGIFLSKKQPTSDGDGKIQIVDCVPLFHSSLTLSPGIEIALSQIDTYCITNGLEISGYYHANENIDDHQ